MKPLIRWAGGKRRLIEQILPLIGEVKGRYVEPFCGSAAIFFALEHQGPALLNDISGAVTKMLKGVAASPNMVTKQLVELSKLQGEVGHFVVYQHLVEVLNSGIRAQAKFASTFIALNQTSFNGLWRVNQSGGYNVPIGYKRVNGQKVPYNIDPLDLRGHAKVMKKTEITCSDFRKIKLKKGDVGYCDPPYAKQFSQYAEEGFGLKDHEDLFNWCTEQARRGARIILSGADNEATRNIYGTPALCVERACTIGASNRGRAGEAIYIWD